MEDALLVEHVLLGDDSCYSRLVERHEGRVYALCFSYVMNHAECQDLVQEVFIKCYERLDSLRDFRKFPGFLASIARNLCLNHLRAKKRRETMESDLAQQLHMEAVDKMRELSQVERQEIQTAVRTLVDALPQKTREVVCLYYMEQLPAKEIAEMLSLRVSAVLQRLRYGRKLLGSRIEAELEPALLTRRDRANLCHAIVAAIPFGKAPWCGKGLVTASVSPPASLAKTLGVAAAALCAAGFILFAARPVESPAPPASASAVVHRVEKAGDTESPPPPPVLEDSKTTSVAAAAPIGSAVAPGAIPGGAPSPAVSLRLGPPPWELRPDIRSILEQLVKAYHDAHPSGNVTIGEESGVTPAAFEPGELGDVMILQGATLASPGDLARLVEAGLVAPLDDRIGDPAFDREDFFPNVWDLVTYKGSVWGVPLLIQSWAIAVDPERVDLDTVKAGLKDWDALAGLLEQTALYDEGQDQPTDTDLLLEPGILWQSLFLHYGGDLNREDSLYPGSDAWRAATEQFVALASRNPEAVPPKVDHWREGGAFFGSIRISYDGGEGTLSHAQLKRVCPGCVLFPAPGTGSVAPANTLVVAIKRGAPEYESAAWDFVHWLTSEKVIRSKFLPLGITPFRKSIVRNLAFEDVRVFAAQIERMRFHRPKLEPLPDALALEDSFNRLMVDQRAAARDVTPKSRENSR